MTFPKTIALAALFCMALAPVALVAKPPAGPEPAPVAPKQTLPDALTPDQQRVVDSQIARDKADRMRADFESHHKPGPVPQEANKQFNDIVEAFRAAIDIDPSGEVATYCRLRLSCAYTYIGDFNAGLRILEEAVNASVGISDRVRACQEAAYHCLQAMHKPGRRPPMVQTRRSSNPQNRRPQRTSQMARRQHRRNCPLRKGIEKMIA